MGLGVAKCVEFYLHKGFHGLLADSFVPFAALVLADSLADHLGTPLRYKRVGAYFHQLLDHMARLPVVAGPQQEAGQLVVDLVLQHAVEVVCLLNLLEDALMNLDGLLHLALLVELDGPEPVHVLPEGALVGGVDKWNPQLQGLLDQLGNGLLGPQQVFLVHGVEEARILEVSQPDLFEQAPVNNTVNGELGGGREDYLILVVHECVDQGVLLYQQVVLQLQADFVLGQRSIAHLVLLVKYGEALGQEGGAHRALLDQRVRNPLHELGLAHFGDLVAGQEPQQDQGKQLFHVGHFLLLQVLGLDQAFVNLEPQLVVRLEKCLDLFKQLLHGGALDLCDEDIQLLLCEINCLRLSEQDQALSECLFEGTEFVERAIALPYACNRCLELLDCRHAGLFGHVEIFESLCGQGLLRFIETSPFEGRDPLVLVLGLVDLLSEEQVVLDIEVRIEDGRLANVLDDPAEVAAHEIVVAVLPELLVDPVLAAEHHHLGLALQLLHVPHQQGLLLEVADDEGADVLLRLHVLAQAAVAQRPDRVLVQLLPYVLELGAVVMLVDDVHR